MADTRTLTIKFKAEGGQEVSRVVKEIKKDGDTVYTKILKDGKLVSESFKTGATQGRNFAGALTAISTSYMAATQAIGSATRVLGGWIDAAREEERSIQRRRVALGEASAAQVAALESQAQAYLNLYGVADDVTRQTQAQAKFFGIATENIDELTRASLGYTEIVGGEMSANVEKLSRFVLGLGTTVKGTTIHVKDNATFLERLNAVMKWTEGGVKTLDDRMKTSEGQLERTAEKWDELKESLGTKLMPVVSDLAGEFEKLLDWYNDLDPGAQNIVSWSAASVVALTPVALTLGAIAQAAAALKTLGLFSGGGVALGSGAVGASAIAGGLAGALAWLWPTTTASDEFESTHQQGAYPLSLAKERQYPGLIEYLRGGGPVDQNLLKPPKLPGGGKKPKTPPRWSFGGLGGLRGMGGGGISGPSGDLLAVLASSFLGDMTGFADLSLSGSSAMGTRLGPPSGGPRTMLGRGRQFGPGGDPSFYYPALAMADYAHPGGYNSFFQYNDQVPKPGWQQKLGGAFGQQGLASVAGGFMQGGLGGGISSALGVAGSAFGPWGALAGGLLGNIFGGLFGKKKRQNRDGQSNATALIFQSPQLEDIKTAMLNLTRNLRQSGAGLNNTLGSIQRQQAGR